MPKKTAGPDDFVWVRSIFGKGPDAVKQYKFIPNGGVNEVIENWQAKQEERKYDCATPSRMTQCPYAVWLHNHGVKPINTMGWGIRTRMLLGRGFENKIAEMLADEGLLLHHWKDDEEKEAVRFKLGTGDNRLEGTPDLLLKLDKPTISDAKTSRSDSFGYVPMFTPDVWDDWGWYKYKVQVDAYFMLCLANKWWFTAAELPLPEQCHLFSYALDDGIVRREFTWTPSEQDFEVVRLFTRRFNEAITASSPPECTCRETTDQFEMKFCPYGIVEEGDKVASTCCSKDLIKESNNG